MITGSSSKLTQLSFHPSGTFICTGSDDGTVRMWDIATGEQKGELRDLTPSAGESLRSQGGGGGGKGKNRGNG